MRPLADDLVGVGEPLLRREDRSRVAHRHPVAEVLADAGYRSSEVDGAEDEHARRRRERLDEDGDLVLATFAIWAVVPDTGLSLGEHPAGVVGDRRVESLGAEGSFEPVWPDRDLCGGRGLTTDDRCQRHRLL